MSVILQQQFPLGRFYATRWKQNPFEDRYGEWPPSPWRLLRAVMARWFQYSRETGDEDAAVRDELLTRLASTVPQFSIPAMSWRAEPAVRQYHKTGVEWTAKGKKDSAYKKSMTTLVPDHCRAVPPNECLYWFWQGLDLPEHVERLMDHLLRRMLYFGRAESFCQLRRVDNLPAGVELNCLLSAETSEHAPVLIAMPGQSLNLASLAAATDDALFQGHSIPPGSVWHYAQLPKRPAVQHLISSKPHFPSTLHVVQFAVGGRVYPQLREWIRVTERFRGRALKELARLLTCNTDAQFASLPTELRERFALFSGKSATGMPLYSDRHTYFALLPDKFGLPTRLVCFRREPFQPEEVAALMAASEFPCSWRYPSNRVPSVRDEWQIRFVPLPFETPAPPGLTFGAPASATWTSATPYVTPGGRRRFRKNGRLRPGETPERLLGKLLAAAGHPPAVLESLTEETQAEWVAVHETPEQRLHRRRNRTRAVLPGFRFRLTFPQAVSGPICLGHSCHFGLGLFVPEY